MFDLCISGACTTSGRCSKSSKYMIWRTRIFKKATPNISCAVMQSSSPLNLSTRSNSLQHSDSNSVSIALQCPHWHLGFHTFEHFTLPVRSAYIIQHRRYNPCKIHTEKKSTTCKADKPTACFTMHRYRAMPFFFSLSRIKWRTNISIRHRCARPRCCDARHEVK